MATEVKVKATKPGYYSHKRIRVDEVFMMEEKFAKGYELERDGKTLKVPAASWIVVIEEPKKEETSALKSGK